jgi:hypothetical protein
MDKRYLLAWAVDPPYSWVALSNLLDDRHLGFLNPDSRCQRPTSVTELNKRKATSGEERQPRDPTLPNGEAELGRVVISQNDSGMKPHILTATFFRFRQGSTFECCKQNAGLNRWMMSQSSRISGGIQTTKDSRTRSNHDRALLRNFGNGLGDTFSRRN